MNKLLILSGPTATGKTALAIEIAQKFAGELISADSRQIYRGMDIGTGKDHPPNIKINLIDIINPDQSFSVAQFRQLAIENINEIHSQNKLPIIVGGTGQYIDALVNPRPTFAIPPHNFLRFFLNHLPLKFLQHTLKTLDFKTFNSLNNSDLHNPHRLIRKIEIRLSKKKIADCSLKIEDYDILHLSLTAPNQFLYSRVDTRVQSRLDAGLLAEIKMLLKKYKWTDPGLNTLAYMDFRPYFVETPYMASLLSRCIESWRFAEHAYVRRQKTWFKKINPLFIDISTAGYKKNLMTKINKWYNQ
ncbi:MAG: tRNA (adenosine(37)-N6)-dimethylallyltransferase MiaA [Microgenomates group bacterium]